jgi:hypothetical protein
MARLERVPAPEVEVPARGRRRFRRRDRLWLRCWRRRRAGRWSAHSVHGGAALAAVLLPHLVQGEEEESERNGQRPLRHVFGIERRKPVAIR